VKTLKLQRTQRNIQVKPLNTSRYIDAIKPTSRYKVFVKTLKLQRRQKLYKKDSRS
jgi:hypothetical protein